MTTSPKQKLNIAVRLTDDLGDFLRSQAAAARRTISAEIRMRLERTRQQDEQPTIKEGPHS